MLSAHIWCWPTSVETIEPAGIISDSCFNNKGAKIRSPGGRALFETSCAALQSGEPKKRCLGLIPVEYDLVDVTTNRHRPDVFTELCRIDIDMDNFSVRGAKVSSLPVTRSSKRAPITINRSLSNH